MMIVIYKFDKCGILFADGAFNSSLSTLLVVINFLKFCFCNSFIDSHIATCIKHFFCL